MKNVWVTESANGYGMTVETTAKLYEAVSEFQKIEIYETARLGRMLLLDGVIQLTEFDEFSYQEMLAHLPLFVHAAPEKVLVVGGGDGGVLREIARHRAVKSIDLCEIDAMVIAASKKYLPALSCGFADPRVTVHIGDGTRFVREHRASYDVIIVDSTDPIGPGEALFNADFYADVKRALRPGGVVASQSESIWSFPEIVTRLVGITRALFPHVGYAQFAVPSYPTGMIGACVASLGGPVTRPVRPVPPEMRDILRYYTAAIHTASFVLPSFAEKFLPSGSPSVH